MIFQQAQQARPALDKFDQDMKVKGLDIVSLPSPPFDFLTNKNEDGINGPVCACFAFSQNTSPSSVW